MFENQGLRTSFSWRSTPGPVAWTPVSSDGTCGDRFTWQGFAWCGKRAFAGASLTCPPSSSIPCNTRALSVWPRCSPQFRSRLAARDQESPSPNAVSARGPPRRTLRDVAGRRRSLRQLLAARLDRRGKDGPHRVSEIALSVRDSMEKDNARHARPV